MFVVNLEEESPHVGEKQISYIVNIYCGLFGSTRNMFKVKVKSAK